MADLFTSTRERETVRGTLASIRYENKSGFLIASLDDQTTVKGTLPNPSIGKVYTFGGRWDNDPKWGPQFLFAEYQSEFPKDGKAVARYLAMHCDWIGPVIALRCVDTFGPDTLAKMKDSPGEVAERVAGLTLARAERVSKMLLDNERWEVVEVEIERLLGGAGLGRSVLGKILAAYGDAAPAIITDDPYRMIGDIAGIGFVTADKIALMHNVKRDDLNRMTAGIIHVLGAEGAAKGHTFLPVMELVNAVAALLGVPHGKIGEVVEWMATKPLPRDRLISITERRQIVIEDGRVSLTAVFKSEQLIVKRLAELMATEPTAGLDIRTGNENLDVLAADQTHALETVLDAPVMVLTGAPGTGKTFTIKVIREMFRKSLIYMAAPSGKAAKRIREQTGIDEHEHCETIHRMLGARWSSDGGFNFEHHRGNPLDCNVLILDEVSMLDLRMFALVLDALTDGTRLILVGDPDQLPSIGAGNVLLDLIASKVIPCAELTEIKRQDAGLIIRSCHRIKAGQDIEVDNTAESDLFFMHRDSETEIRDTVVDLASGRLAKRYGFDTLRDVQVLAATTERTEVGCKALNLALQARLTPLQDNVTPPGDSTVDGGSGSPMGGDTASRSAMKWRVGDKVIQTKNDYRLFILNGDIGFIARINHKRKMLTVEFVDPCREVDIPMSGNKLQLAYAVTVHKFQGSEAPAIVIPIWEGYGPMLMQRNWLYTAISRARQVCVIVGKRSEVGMIVRRRDQEKRHTALALKLREGIV